MLKVSMIQERYRTYLLENHQKFYNENYKTYELKDKLCKLFGKKLAFWQPRKRAELVYAADIEGEAVEVAFELAPSDERSLIECATVIRRHMNEGNLCLADSLRKHAYSNVLKISPPKTESFQIKNLIFFIFLLKT